MLRGKLKKETKGVRTWVTVDRAALHHNYDIFRALLRPGCRLMAVVKSNAYGHDFIQYTQELEDLGADWFGADSITEAVALSKAGIKKPILVLGYTLPDRMEDAQEWAISITVSSLEQLRRMRAKPKIHLKIDTGMHRQGINLKELPVALKLIRKKNLNLEGVYTHFAAAKDPKFRSPTQKQLEIFETAVKTIREEGFRPIVHAVATGGTLAFREAHFDMVRVGIGLMGLWPASETKQVFSRKYKLRPVLNWQTLISETKNIKAGEAVGYDLSEKVRRDSRIAVCPVGYWHGIPRNLSGKGYVLVRGRKVKILGRVSMDMIVIDITDIGNAKARDVVTLIGQDGKSIIYADDVAKIAGTINYEIVTRLNPTMRRIYI